MPVQLPESPAFAPLRQQLAKRILVLDGATGTMIQQYKLSEDEYRGTKAKDLDPAVQAAIAKAVSEGIMSKATMSCSR